MKDEILRWSVLLGNHEFEHIVFECGTCAVFDRTAYVAAYPDSASRLYGVLVEDGLLANHLKLCGAAPADLFELARELRHRNPSKIEQSWLDVNCLDYVRSWMQRCYPDVLAQLESESGRLSTSRRTQSPASQPTRTPR